MLCLALGSCDPGGATGVDAPTSQQRADSVDLAVSPHARVDAVQPGRAVVIVRADGTVLVGRERLAEEGGADVVLEALEPSSDPGDPLLPAKQWLEGVRLGMKTRPYECWWGAEVELPDEPLLLRVDRDAPFGQVREILLWCMDEARPIWRLQFGLATSRGERGYLPYDLPHRLFLEDGPRECVEVRIGLEPNGTEARLLKQWIGPFPSNSLGDLEEKLARIQEARRRSRPLDRATGEPMPVPAAIDVGEGVRFGEVLPVWDSLISVGYREIELTTFNPW